MAGERSVDVRDMLGRIAYPHVFAGDTNKSSRAGYDIEAGIGCVIESGYHDVLKYV